MGKSKDIKENESVTNTQIGKKYLLLFPILITLTCAFDIREFYLYVTIAYVDPHLLHKMFLTLMIFAVMSIPAMFFDKIASQEKKSVAILIHSFVYALFLLIFFDVEVYVWLVLLMFLLLFSERIDVVQDFFRKILRKSNFFDCKNFVIIAMCVNVIEATLYWIIFYPFIGFMPMCVFSYFCFGLYIYLKNTPLENA